MVVSPVVEDQQRIPGGMRPGGAFANAVLTAERVLARVYI
jgi:hypothetical protein